MTETQEFAAALAYDDSLSPVDAKRKALMDAIRDAEREYGSPAYVEMLRGWLAEFDQRVRR